MSDWKTVKIKDKTYEELKKMGVGISRAVDALLRLQREKVEGKIEELRKMGEDIAEILFRYGVFNIKLVKAGISDIEESGDDVKISGFVIVRIPHEEVRKKIIEVIRGGV